MSIEKNDYLIIKPKQGKNYLAQYKGKSEGSLLIVPEEDKSTKAREVLIKEREVLMNVGPDPAPGKCYGIEVGDRYIKTFHHEFWGPIDAYHKLDAETLQLFRKSLDRTAKKMEKLKLEHHLPGTVTEIRCKQGKWAGRYAHKTEEGKRSVMMYAPEWAQGSAETMDYVVIHEFGHRVRYNGVTSKKMRARWLKLFNRSIAPTMVEPQFLKDVLKGIKNAEGDAKFKEVLKEFADEEEGQAAVKTLGRWFTQVHHLGMADLSVLFEAGDIDSIEKLWPTRSIDSSKLSPIVSEYACKNVEELFAESFALHYTSQKELPAKVVSLLEESVSMAKSQ